MELLTSPRAIGAQILILLALLFAGPTMAAIGRTPGAGWVTPGGEAAYAIPLRLPPGTNGMTPALSLEYRHRRTSGLPGVGWSIAGLSSIERCARTVAQDGAIGPVTQTSADRFCLDGQRLVVVNGYPYGASGAEYRTEIESFARIRSWGRAGAGPAYFVLEAFDGRVLEYGATADSRIDMNGRLVNGTATVRAWTLSQARDRSGNVIRYEYTKVAGNGSHRIAAIRYNENPGAGVAASHAVSFVYESRPADEVDTSSVAGLPMRQVVRLDRVDVLYNGGVVRRYDLTYEPSLSSAGRSRLAAVQECGVGGVDCLAPTLLRWQDGQPGFGVESTASASSAALDYFVTDIDGDGRDDFVWSAGSPAAQTLRYRLSREGGPGPEVDTGVSTAGGAGAPLDYNGDGYGDVVMISAARRWLVLPGRATGLGMPIDTGLPANGIADFRGADMNGDGLGDLAYSEIEGTTLSVYVRYAQLGGTFSAQPAKVYDQYFAAGYDWYEGGDFLGARGQQIDLDGDGREDLLLNESYTVARISADHAARDFFDSSFAGSTPADVNGDGCTDFVYPHSTGRWRIRFSACDASLGTVPDLPGPPVAAARAFAFDVNGDGRDDILYRDGTATWQVAMSGGSGLLPAVSSGVAHGGAPLALAADVNGDGLQDIVTVVSGTLRQRLRTGPVPDLLLSASDGFGVTAAFEYAPLTSGLHTRLPDATYPDRDAQDARQVVAVLSVSDGSGSGALAHYRFRYAGLKRNLAGRGDLGFASRTVTDGTLGDDLQTEEAMRQDFPYIGLVTRRTVRQASGLPLQERASQWSSLAYVSGEAQRYLPYLAAATDTQYEAGGAYNGTPHTRTTLAVAAIDGDSGLVTDRTLTVTELATGLGAGSSRSERLLHSSVMNDAANWCLGRPQATQLTAMHTLPGGGSITRSTSHSWDALKCRPTQQQVEPGSSQWQVTTAFGYDSFGNLSSRSITGAGMETRTGRLHWGPRGQLPVTATNALGQATTLVWDHAQGVTVSLTDPNTLTTQWSYDGFGRVVVETRPDQTRTSWNRATCTTGCGSRTRYVLHAHEHDVTGAVQQANSKEFDQFERPYRVSSQRPDGQSVALTDFDARGRPRRDYAPQWRGGAGNGYRQFSYDQLGRVTSQAWHAASGAVDRSLSLAYDGLTTTLRDARGNVHLRVSTAWGDMLRATDPMGGSSHYRHDAFGSLTRVADPLNVVVSDIAYNVRGMKTAQVDADLGAWTLTPNALGEIVAQRDAKNQQTTFTYDKLSRPVTRREPEGLTSWVWGSSAAARNIGHLASVSGPGYSEAHAYDSLARPATRTIVSDATYEYAFAYNHLGLLDTLTYPLSTHGYRLRLAYEYAAGQPVRIRDSRAPATVLWEMKQQDAGGNVIHETLGESIDVVTGFSALTGLVEYRQAGLGGNAALQNLAYQWDAAGNLLARQDLNQGLVESFEYDALDRLGRSRRNGTTTLELRYDAIGNINWKSDVGSYGYDSGRRHAAVTAGDSRFSYDANGNMTGRNGADLSWFSYNLPATLRAANGSHSQFSYAPDRTRWRQVASASGASETTIYVGGLMEKVSATGLVTYRHYITSPTGVVALYLRKSSGSPAEATYYLTRDHLGSTDKILNAAGVTVAVAASFDAFGKRRAGDWAGAPGAAALVAIGQTTRDGFTGHEHLDNLGLIHMNGRVYDPVIARFLSADPAVQAPFNSQSLNRYTYVWNNPLSLVDPSGYEGGSPADGGGKFLCWKGDCEEVMWWLNRGGSYYASQAVSAAERDPCGQDGSAMACHGPRGGAFAALPLFDTATTPQASQILHALDWIGQAVDRDLRSAADSTETAARNLLGLLPGADLARQAEARHADGEHAAATLLALGSVADASLAYLSGGTSVATRRGIVVLGRYMHHYDEIARSLSANYYHVPARISRGWSTDRKWLQNERWLDKMIARRHPVWLVTPLQEVGEGSWLRREIDYLRRRGYTLGEDGRHMIPPDR